MVADFSLVLVFSAGLLSFLSPCVLPLIPSYFSILGGLGMENETENSVNRLRLLRTAIAFVLGFSVVFITLGIVVSTTFALMGGASRYLNWAAGIIVIILGINIFFDFFSFLNYEKRPFFNKLMHKPKTQGMPSAFIAGAAFGVGWTPCIGPILTTILLMAGQSGKTVVAAAYLGIYSLGLALTFILVALFFEKFLKHTPRIRSFMPVIRRISGILLIVIGITILTGRYSMMNMQIQRMMFAYIDWAQTKPLPFRILADFFAWLKKF